MNEQYHKEAAEIKKAPAELLDYLPARRWRGTWAALTAVVILLLVFLGQLAYIEFKYTKAVAELNLNEALWNSKGISNYEFSLWGHH